MNKKQLEHFRQKLLAWKAEIVADLGHTINHLKDESVHLADPNDRATQESEFALELRTRDRERKLLAKINQGLARIDDGSYGYCEETGDEIGVARLEIRPVATLCVEAQERRERSERQYIDR
ncbi:MAG: RNA polymerase-binding protein DksA [Gammaproteobacteria bacterium]|nr:RNA polymerase-binding protein DksA [Gammaproteobacteria bacterium]